MTDFPIPILLIVFKRDESLAAQVDILRAIRPSRLYVFADGPASEADVVDCLRARAVVEGIDWPCEVNKKYKEIHLGCGKGPATAMDWFFANVPEGIILEDDLLPHPDFFRFCAELLDRYRDEPRVMEISGTNRLGRWDSEGFSYCFSHWGSECGWATWRRAWRHFDYSVRAWADLEERRILGKFLPRRMQTAFLSRILERTWRSPDTVSWWDYQWVFAKMRQSGLAVVPNVNLVRNIGCDAHSHHDRDPSHRKSASVRLSGIDFPLRHPLCIAPDRVFDKCLLRQAISWRHYVSIFLPDPLKRRLKRLCASTVETA